jgi:hypothetical protein
MAIAWYYPFEMELLLKKAGFSSISTYDLDHQYGQKIQMYKAFS